jgi:hypothetical protein
MTSGYIKLSRSIFENKLWESEPFTRAQAWLDLFGKANYEEGVVFIRGIEVKIQRGQTCRAEESLAKTWKWSRGKVRRFLEWLEKESMIERKQYNKISIITICNYGRYNDSKNEDSTTNSTTESQQTDNKQYPIKKNKKNKKNNTYTEAFERWWSTYPKRNGRRVGKENAFREFKKIDTSLWSELKKATVNYSSECNGLPKDAERFLKKDFWKDYINTAITTNHMAV